MTRYVAIFDNCVTDDLLIHFITAKDLDDANDQAYIISKKTGYSEGNYDLFVDVIPDNFT